MNRVLTDPPSPQPLLQLLALPEHTDARGRLVAIEGGIDIPFDVKRVYYLTSTISDARGFHAHRELSQLMICVAGAVRVTIDDGRQRESVTLDNPSVGLLVGPMKWREMDRFSEDAVLLVLASAHYDEADYMRDYSEFLAAVGVKP